MKQAILYTLLLVSVTVKTQTFEWAKTCGGGSSEYVESIQLDSSGDIITVGFFRGTADFDPGAGTTNLTSAGGSDIFVQKLDASGNFIWAKAFGGTSDDYGTSVVTDAANNVYITGHFSETVDFDPGAGTTILTSAGYTDNFVQKLDSSGDLVWVKHVGGTGFDSSTSIHLDELGNVYTAGQFWGTVDFDPGAGTTNLTSNGSGDVYIQKLNTSGSFVWAKSFGGGSFDTASSMTVDSLGNIYTTGEFEGTADFDPGIGTNNLTSLGATDFFTQKLDPSGNFLWARVFGSTSSDYSPSISIDYAGNVYTAGSFSGSIDFDPGVGTTNLTAVGSENVFVQKLDDSGDFLWVKSFEGTDYSNCWTVLSDSSGNVYTTGNFSGTVDFDPGTGTRNHTTAGVGDIFIQKMDDAGNFLWAKSFGGSGSDGGRTITIDDGGYIYTAGSFSDVVDFDPAAGIANHTSAGGVDMFIQKLGPCISSSSGTDIQTACNSYTWIDGNTYTSNNNTATYILENSIGCDSIVTLDLTIIPFDATATQIDAVTIQANTTGASYQWLDCDNNYAPINGETGQSFEATSNGNYAVEVSTNNCTDTSDCFVINSVGLPHQDINEGIELFPNPTSGKVKVIFNEVHTRSMTLTNLKGQKLKEIEVNDKGFELDLSAFPSGIYFLNVESDEGILVKKIVKE